MICKVALMFLDSFDKLHNETFLLYYFTERQKRKMSINFMPVFSIMTLGSVGMTLLRVWHCYVSLLPVSRGRCCYVSDAVVLQPYFLLLSLCADSGRGEPPPQPLLFSQLPAPLRSTVGGKKSGRRIRQLGNVSSSANGWKLPPRRAMKSCRSQWKLVTGL